MKKLFFVVILFIIFTFPVVAQDFNFSKAREDFVFTEDNYRTKLTTFNLKKDSYQKNPTLSLKEESRIALLDFLGARNSFVKSYLNMVRTKTINENVYLKIDPEIVWFDTRKNNYTETNTLEDILSKSKEEDERYLTTTLPIIYFSLANINLNNVVTIKNSHIKLYQNLKKESEDLVKLGRADASLFDRWFKDIDEEINTLSEIEAKTLTHIQRILSNDDYRRNSAYKKSAEELYPSKESLLRLNEFIKELENVLEGKR